MGDTLGAVTAARIVLYTGKGGVGKTTIAASHAAWAASPGGGGLRTLVASADAAHSLGDVLGESLYRRDRREGGGVEPIEVGRGLSALEVDARAEMERHWGSIRDYLVAIFRYQGIEATVAEELALLPGAEELTTLLAVEAHARSGRYDLVLVDCAPTGSALRLLTLPEVARSAIRVLLRVQQAITGMVTPLARSVLSVPLPESKVFGDAERLLYRKLRGLRRRLTAETTSVRLVVTPERMVIDEALRAHTDLALFDLRPDAVVMNRILPDAALEETFFHGWGRLQEERLQEVAERFAPLPVLRSALAEDELQGLEALAAHGAAWLDGWASDAVLCHSVGLRIRAAEGHWLVELPLPHADSDALDVAKLDEDLWISTGSRRRAVRLPRPLVRSELIRARLSDGLLTVQLSRPPVD
jgi:arsenite-transporting ATPase